LIRHSFDPSLPSLLSLFGKQLKWQPLVTKPIPRPSNESYHIVRDTEEDWKQQIELCMPSKVQRHDHDNDYDHESEHKKHVRQTRHIRYLFREWIITSLGMKQWFEYFSDSLDDYGEDECVRSVIGRTRNLLWQLRPPPSHQKYGGDNSRERKEKIRWMQQAPQHQWARTCTLIHQAHRFLHNIDTPIASLSSNETQGEERMYFRVAPKDWNRLMVPKPNNSGILSAPRVDQPPIRFTQIMNDIAHNTNNGAVIDDDDLLECHRDGRAKYYHCPWLTQYEMQPLPSLPVSFSTELLLHFLQSSTTGVWSPLLPNDQSSLSPLAHILGETTCSSLQSHGPLIIPASSVEINTKALTRWRSVLWSKLTNLPPINRNRFFYGTDRSSLIARVLVRHQRYQIAHHIAVARRHLCQLSLLFIREHQVSALTTSPILFDNFRSRMHLYDLLMTDGWGEWLASVFWLMWCTTKSTNGRFDHWSNSSQRAHQKEVDLSPTLSCSIIVLMVPRWLGPIMIKATG
jgi:hypothetical protein